MASIYALGVPWLKSVTEMTWPAALSAGIVPFLIGDAIKIAAAVAAQHLVLPRIHWLQEVPDPAPPEPT
jgi:biotin transport system substrate-specific component